MRGTNRKRALLVSGSVILLCMTIIVGMTWALFTDTETVFNHLVAGDLQITLKRVELTKTTLDEHGFLVTSNPDASVIDFSDPANGDKNVFGLKTDGNGSVTEKIVPGSKFVAKMQIENNSDVAFGYWVKIVCKDQSATKELAKQLKVKVYTDKNGDGIIDTSSEGDESTIANGLTVGDHLNSNYIGVLGIGDVENFIVSVEFNDLGYDYDTNGVLTSGNDEAQGKATEFDLVVYAIQVTDAPTP